MTESSMRNEPLRVRLKKVSVASDPHILPTSRQIERMYVPDEQSILKTASSMRG